MKTDLNELNHAFVCLNRALESIPKEWALWRRVWEDREELAKLIHDLEVEYVKSKREEPHGKEDAE